MKRIPVFFSDEITQGEMRELFRNAGLHLHTEAGMRLVVDRVPRIVRPDPPQTNVLEMKRVVNAKGKA